jgi:mannose-6-phosphate isomerase
MLAALRLGGKAGRGPALAEVLQGAAGEPGAVAEFTAACRRQLAAPGDDPGPYATPVALARRHPEDRALPVVAMMNHVSLAPGEGLYIPPGTLHTYLRGLAVELMTPSDNVLRAGLTTKYTDPGRVVQTLDLVGGAPARPAVTREGGVRMLRPPGRQFQLADVRVSGSVEVPLEGPRVALVLDGEVTAFTTFGSLHLGLGKSLFALAKEGRMTLRGKGRVILAAS